MENTNGQDKPVIEVKLILSTTGEVFITGPLDQKLAIIGMLEMAKQIVYNFKPSSILPASAQDVKRIDKNH